MLLLAVDDLQWERPVDGGHNVKIVDRSTVVLLLSESSAALGIQL